LAVSLPPARCPIPLAIPGLPSDLHSPSGFFVPSGSKHHSDSLPGGSPSRSARSPFAPRSPFYRIGRLRINVRGSLLPRRLAAA
jgi:hypothetical protein